MSSVPTFIATIYVGSRIQYSEELIPLEVGEAVVQEYVNEIGQCFTVTRTEYIYKNGREPGLIVGCINYPRFPKQFYDLKAQVRVLARYLLDAMRQQRVSIVFPDETEMLSCA